MRGVDVEIYLTAGISMQFKIGQGLLSLWQDGNEVLILYPRIDKKWKVNKLNFITDIIVKLL